jgi:poly(3-hydroxybutyrate) depolymerase
LPAGYDPRRPWPLILAFDPGGRGRRPVEQYQAAAEKFGYIVAGSNVSRNGSWAVSMAAAQFMSADVTTRFAIDTKRVYTAGMSGGARVAMGIALNAPNVVAGVVASSAGYPDSKPRKTLPFVVFGTAGTEDFNWLEMRSLDHTLGSPHHVAVFEGGHVWLPSELAVEAVEWLDLQAMKTGRLPRDEARLNSIFTARQAKAVAIESEYQRYQALEALAADFEGIRSVSFQKTKAVRDAQKKEQAEEYQERRLLGDILGWEQELSNSEQRSQAFAKLADQWKRLSASANVDTDSPNRRIARRVTRGLAMGATDRTQDAEYLQLLSKYRPARREGGR